MNFTKTTIAACFFALWVVTSSGTAHADVTIQYQYDSKLNVTGVNAIIGIEEVFPDCNQRIADLVIDEVVYDGASDLILGFRAKKPAPQEWYGIFRISDAIYKSISNAERSQITRLIKKSAHVVELH